MNNKNNGTLKDAITIAESKLLTIVEPIDNEDIGSLDWLLRLGRSVNAITNIEIDIKIISNTITITTDSLMVVFKPKYGVIHEIKSDSVGDISISANDITEPNTWSILNNLVKRVNVIFNSKERTWEEKYGLIFSKELSIKINEMLYVDWCDPDTTYQDDLIAYVSALNEKMSLLDIDD